MNVNNDINNGGENTPASRLLVNNVSAASNATLGSNNSAAIETVAGHETVAFQRFHNVSQIGIPTVRINKPDSETASRPPYSPCEDYYSLGDARSQWSFHGGLTSPNSPGRTLSEYSFHTRDPLSPTHNNKANDSMLRINSSIFRHGLPIRLVGNPRFGNIDLIKQLRSIRVQMQPETLTRIRKHNENFTKNGPPILEDNCTLLQCQDWQNELFQFVEHLPGYVPGMLFIQPEYSSLVSGEERENCIIWFMVTYLSLEARIPEMCRCFLFQMLFMVESGERRLQSLSS